MNIKAVIPTAPEVVREAVILLLGAAIATLIVRGLPDGMRQHFTWFPDER